MRLGQDEIERIAERTSNLVVKKLTSSFDFSLPQAELTAEKVLQKMEAQSQINQIAHELAEILSEEQKERLMKLAQSRSEETTSTESPGTADGGMEVAPEAPPSSGTPKE